MESTGGTTTSKMEKHESGSQTNNSIPASHYKYIPSIQEQGLGEKSNKKRLQTLFNCYLRPV